MLKYIIDVAQPILSLVLTEVNIKSVPSTSKYYTLLPWCDFGGNEGVKFKLTNGTNSNVTLLKSILEK